MFTKTTPGHACKLAATCGAKWSSNKGWEEATIGEKVIAYRDQDGWFVNSEWDCFDLSNVVA